MGPKVYEAGNHYRTRYPETPPRPSRHPPNHYPNAPVRAPSPASAEEHVLFDLPDLTTSNNQPTMAQAQAAYYPYVGPSSSVPLPVMTHSPYPSLASSTAPYIRPPTLNPLFSTQQTFNLNSGPSPYFNPLQDVSSRPPASNVPRPPQESYINSSAPVAGMSAASYGMIDAWLSTNAQVISAILLSHISRC